MGWAHAYLQLKGKALTARALVVIHESFKRKAREMVEVGPWPNPCFHAKEWGQRVRAGPRVQVVEDKALRGEAP
jgi:hypothetical protein